MSDDSLNLPSKPLDNPEEEEFCDLICKGMKSWQAYNAGLKKSLKQSSASSAASKLQKKPHIRARIVFLRRHADDFLYRHEDYTKEEFLTRLVQLATQQGDERVSLNAMTLLARIQGWDKPKEKEANDELARTKSLLGKLNLDEGSLPKLDQKTP